MLRYPGDKMTAVEEDEMLGELNQPLRKVAKPGFGGLYRLAIFYLDGYWNFCYNFQRIAFSWDSNTHLYQQGSMV